MSDKQSWRRDPTGRAQLRGWDGSAYTSWVWQEGEIRLDEGPIPPPPPSPPPPNPDASDLAGVDRTTTGAVPPADVVRSGAPDGLPKSGEMSTSAWIVLGGALVGGLVWFVLMNILAGGPDSAIDAVAANSGPVVQVDGVTVSASNSAMCQMGAIQVLANDAGPVFLDLDVVYHRPDGTVFDRHRAYFDLAAGFEGTLELDYWLNGRAGPDDDPFDMTCTLDRVSVTPK